MKKTLIILFVLLSGTIFAQKNYPDLIGLVGQLNKWELKPTGVKFTAGPIWWNPQYQVETPPSEWQIEYNYLLKWDVKGVTYSTTIKTWDNSTFWVAPAGVNWVTYTIKAVPHHKDGKHTANDSFTCGALLYLQGIFK